MNIENICTLVRYRVGNRSTEEALHLSGSLESSIEEFVKQFAGEPPYADEDMATEYLGANSEYTPHIIKLKTGLEYDVSKLACVGWSETVDNGYNAFDYFSVDGMYLGPDEYGVEPLFELKEEETKENEPNGYNV